ncbi:MAG TPA: TolC family protein [Terriglobia bacterium]|nr:TolC family protein [Terriglobia bacterium]
MLTKAGAYTVLFLFTISPLLAQKAETSPAFQLVQPQGQAAPPPLITLQDALDRATRLDVQYQLAISNAGIAREDRVQARAALLPGISQTTQLLQTQGNGITPNGRFVTNDGVHVYRSWGVARQEISAETFLKSTYQRAQAGEALANARVEIAQRGLVLTVTRNYYTFLTSQRKYGTAQQSVQQAQRFLEITQQQENAGQAAHSDVVKAQIQYEQQRQAFQEATLGVDNARLNLAVLLFPDFNENFNVVDDLDSAQALPPFPEIQSMAAEANPELRAAQAALRQASFDVRVAKNAFLPAIAIDAVYGIEANAFAVRSRAAAFPEAGVLPNLGFFITANFTLPVFDWGIRQSKVRQAETRERQSQVELTQTQRVLLANLYLYYNEVLTARAAVDVSRRAAELSTESLRLVNLRYQAGESTALEVVDAQKTLVDTHNAYDDAQTRYRVALSQLQTLTGKF